MIEALQFIRKAIITRLTGQITAGGGTVPIYNRAVSYTHLTLPTIVGV